MAEGSQGELGLISTCIERIGHTKPLFAPPPRERTPASSTGGHILPTALPVRPVRRQRIRKFKSPLFCTVKIEILRCSKEIMGSVSQMFDQVIQGFCHTIGEFDAYILAVLVALAHRGFDNANVNQEVLKFACFIFTREEERELTAQGFVLSAQLALKDLENGINTKTGQPIKGLFTSLTHQPPMVYHLLDREIQEIGDLFFHLEFARQIRTFYNKVDAHRRQELRTNYSSSSYLTE